LAALEETNARYKLNRLNPPRSPLVRGEDKAAGRRTAKGWSGEACGKAAQNRVCDKRLFNLEKPAMASLLEVNINGDRGTVSLLHSPQNQTGYTHNRAPGSA
jgi:hypothetical protein